MLSDRDLNKPEICLAQTNFPCVVLAFNMHAVSSRGIVEGLNHAVGVVQVFSCRAVEIANHHLLPDFDGLLESGQPLGPTIGAAGATLQHWCSACHSLCLRVCRVCLLAGQHASIRIPIPLSRVSSLDEPIEAR